MDSTDSFQIVFTATEYENVLRLARLRRTDVRSLIIDLVAAEIDRLEEAASACSGEEEPDATASGESFTDGIEHLIGSVDGPPDLSSSRRRMEGFGS